MLTNGVYSYFNSIKSASVCSPAGSQHSSSHSLASPDPRVPATTTATPPPLNALTSKRDELTAELEARSFYMFCSKQEATWLHWMLIVTKT